MRQLSSSRIVIPLISKSGLNDDVAQCLWQITREKFGEKRDGTIVEKQALAQQWKEYVTALRQ